MIITNIKELKERRGFLLYSESQRLFHFNDDNRVIEGDWKRISLPMTIADAERFWGYMDEKYTKKGKSYPDFWTVKVEFGTFFNNLNQQQQ